jgi:hypothetical protein
VRREEQINQFRVYLHIKAALAYGAAIDCQFLTQQVFQIEVWDCRVPALLVDSCEWNSIAGSPMRAVVQPAHELGGHPHEVVRLPTWAGGLQVAARCMRTLLVRPIASVPVVSHADGGIDSQLPLHMPVLL